MWNMCRRVPRWGYLWGREVCNWRWRLHRVRYLRFCLPVRGNLTSGLILLIRLYKPKESRDFLSEAPLFFLQSHSPGLFRLCMSLFPFASLAYVRARIHAGLLFGDTSYTKIDYQQVTEMFTRTSAHTSGRTKCRTNVGQTNIFFETNSPNSFLFGPQIVLN